jgi:hypothetical protein
LAAVLVAFGVSFLADGMPGSFIVFVIGVIQ